METIKFYDLEKLTSNRSELAMKVKSGMRINVSKTVENHYGSRTITISQNCEAINNGCTKINFAENTLTGDIFIIFNKFSGVDLKRKNGKGNLILTKNNAINLLLQLLNVNYDPKDGVKIDIEFSENLSKLDNNFTYKLIKK